MIAAIKKVIYNLTPLGGVQLKLKILVWISKYWFEKK